MKKTERKHTANLLSIVRDSKGDQSHLITDFQFRSMKTYLNSKYAYTVRLYSLGHPNIRKLRLLCHAIAQSPQNANDPLCRDEKKCIFFRMHINVLGQKSRKISFFFSK